MPLYNVLIEVKNTHYSRIIVEAKNSQVAKSYCNKNIDWHEDAMLEKDGAGGKYREHKVKELKEINETTDLPTGYSEYHYPWNGNGKLTVNEYLEGRVKEK